MIGLPPNLAASAAARRLGLRRLGRDHWGWRPWCGSCPACHRVNTLFLTACRRDGWMAWCDDCLVPEKLAAALKARLQ